MDDKQGWYHRNGEIIKEKKKGGVFSLCSSAICMINSKDFNCNPSFAWAAVLA